MFKNVIFVVETKFQLLLGQILSQYLLEKGCTIRFICYGIEFEKYLNLKSELKILHIPKKFNNEYLTGIIDYYLNYKKLFSNTLTNILVIVFKDHNFLQGKIINVLSKKGARICLFEEGLSLYAQKKSLIHNNLFDLANLKNSVRKTINYALQSGISFEEFGMNKNLEYVCAFDPEYFPDKKKSNANLLRIPNKFQLDRSDQIDYNYLNNIKDYILYLVSPLHLSGDRNLKDHLNQVQENVEILKTLKKNIVIKIHPNDNITLYKNISGIDFIYFKSDLPAELIFYESIPYIVFSEGSSASVNMSRFFGVNSIVLITDFLNNNKFFDTSSIYQVFNKWCHVVRDTDSLKSLIQSIMNNKIDINKGNQSTDKDSWFRFVNTIIK